MPTGSTALAPPGTAQRHRALAAVIASISVVGLSLGLTIPLTSLILESRGTDSGLIGIMAAMPALGILFFSTFIPRLVARLGARATMFGAIMVAASTVLALPVLDYYEFWLVLRFVMGAAVGVLFTISETWINQFAEEHRRGRLVAIYATVLSLCLASGPLLIAVTGTEGVLPFTVAAAILLCATIPQLWTGAAPRTAEESPDFSVFAFMRIAPTLCYAVLLFAFLDACGLSMLPLFGLRHGYDETAAAAMITALVAGNVALQMPIGWLADLVDRYKLLSLCACAMLISATALPFVATIPTLLWPALVLLGAAGGGIYTLSLIIVGQRFQGAALITANAAFGLLWGLGNLSGPLIAGVGMRIYNPDGLPITLALATALFLALFVWRHFFSAQHLKKTNIP